MKFFKGKITIISLATQFLVIFNACIGSAFANTEESIAQKNNSTQIANKDENLINMTGDHKKNKVAFVAYGNEKFKNSRERIKQEALEIGAFDFVDVYTDKNLPGFLEKHGKFVDENKRGGGYWIWKPMAILETMKKLEDNDIAIYVDSGSVLRKEHIEILDNYLKELYLSDANLLVFQMHYQEACWTRADVAKEFGFSIDSPEMLTGQIHATFFLIKKNSESIYFLKDWLSFITKSDYQFVTDETSGVPNHSCFKEHRHDQSAFSLMAKTHGAIIKRHLRSHEDRFFDPQRIRQ